MPPRSPDSTLPEWPCRTHGCHFRWSSTCPPPVTNSFAFDALLPTKRDHFADHSHISLIVLIMRLLRAAVLLDFVLTQSAPLVRKKLRPFPAIDRSPRKLSTAANF